MRNFLSAVIVSLAVMGAAACGDDAATGPVDVQGTYSLRTAGGFNLPATFTNGSSRLEVKSGTLLLEASRFDATLSIEIDDTPSILTYAGLYSQSGNRITFDGTDQDGIDVSLVGIIDGNTITITDPDTGIQLVFRKN
ncbi:MAG: hypothetical protein ACR2G6_02255 [Gemmatimonadaceae bacterium]